jgi:hypothetical protein
MLIHPPSPLTIAVRIALAVVGALIALLCLYAGMARAADAPPMPPSDPPSPAPLVLIAPKSVAAGSGYFKVVADTTPGGKPVSFDVEAQFADPDATFQSEQLDGRTYLIGVPASAGTIRVQAAFQPDTAGAPPVMAKVFIEVTAPPKPAPPAPPAPPPGPPNGPAVGKLFAIFVVDKAAGGAPVQLADSPTLLASLKALGDERAVLDAKSPAVAAQGLTQAVAEAGGAPALVLMDADGQVHKAVKLPAGEPDVLAIINAVHAGK